MPYYQCPKCERCDSFLSTQMFSIISGQIDSIDISGGGGGGLEPIHDSDGKRIGTTPIQIDPIHGGGGGGYIQTNLKEYYIPKCGYCGELLSEKDKKYTKEEEKANEAERKRKILERENANYRAGGIHDVYSFLTVTFSALALAFSPSILQAINVNIDHTNTVEIISKLALVATVYLLYVLGYCLVEAITAFDSKLELTLEVEKFNFKKWLTGVISLVGISTTMGWYYDALSSTQSFSIQSLIWFIFGFLPAIIFILAILLGTMHYIYELCRVEKT